MVTQIFIDPRKCDRCMLCLAACSQGKLKMTDSGIIHDNDCDCGECRKCEYICSRGAISWRYEITVTEKRRLK